ncbi:MAG: hypothetical protein KIB11_10385 [Clostridium perfringens]|nr:hypothetical protein [Clostridium perfringens]
MAEYWGDYQVKEIELPNSILKEAASELETITKKYVYADIQELKPELINEWGERIDSQKFNFGFFIKSKYMDNYSFKVFSIHHDIVFYPLNIKLDPLIEEEIEFDIQPYRFFSAETSENVIVADSEEDFSKLIKMILSSSKIREIVNILYSYSKDYKVIF